MHTFIHFFSWQIFHYGHELQCYQQPYLHFMTNIKFCACLSYMFYAILLLFLRVLVNKNKTSKLEYLLDFFQNEMICCHQYQKLLVL